MTAVHTDFVRAFTPGTVFRDSTGREFPVRQLDAGELVLPTGRIVGSDPTYFQTSGTDRYPPYTRTVPPGRYPIALCLSTHTYPQHAEERVAAVMLRLTDAEPVAWEMALLPGQDPATLPPGHFFGYGVDGGIGCFADARAVESLEPERRMCSERVQEWSGRPRSQPQTQDPAALIEHSLSVWTPFFRRLVEGFFTPAAGKQAWCVDLVAEPKTGANLIAFPSGWGDGCYASYWGLDAGGTVCRLATDFGILLETIEETVTFSVPAVEAAYQHAGMAASGIMAVHLSRTVTFEPASLLTTLVGPDRGPDRTVYVRLDGSDCLTDSPYIQATERKFYPASQGNNYYFNLDEPLPAGAELVLRYRVRTVPL